MCSEDYSTWSVILSVRPFICLSVTTFSATTRNKVAKKQYQKGSIPHWLDFKNGDFCKSTAFKSYGVKTK